MNEPSFSEHFLAAASDGPPLRVGLIVDGRSIGRAAASIVRDLVAAPFVRVELVIVDVRATGATPGPFRRLRTEGGLAFAAYATLDRRRAAIGDDPAELEDLSALLAEVPSLTVGGAADAGPIAVRDAGAPGRLPEAVIERARAASLDVLVHLGSRRLGGGVLDAARYGVWVLRPGQGASRPAGPEAFRELLKASPICSVALVRLAHDTGGSAERGPDLVIDRATFATDPTSLARTRRTSAYGSTHLVVRNLRLLHARGWDWLAGRRLRGETAGPRSATRDGAPSSFDVVRWFVPLALRRLAARIVRTVTRAQDVLHWRVAIRVGHPTTLLDRPDDLDGFTWLESPRGHYYADPFIVERDGRLWLFVEDFDYARDSATIACAELGAAGEVGPVREVLRTAGHLSYPQVIDDGGDAWMVPESTAEGVVRLFRANAFPTEWSAATDLLREPAVDSTVWRHDSLWWLFTTVQEPRGGAAMLMLYVADALEGPWSPHPLNPISQDARTNRGAGHVFLDGGRPIRPSQDGSRGYGYAVTFNEIDILTRTDFAERPRATITPDPVPGMLGLHTYNRVGEVEVIDGKVARPRRTVA